VSAKTRRLNITEQLRVEGEVAISELARQFGTSEMTIRRDLDYLEEHRVARRTRGGAISVQSRSFEPPILQRSSYHAREKAAIGRAAAALVRENETIFLDGGTTPQAMARALSPDVPITVITPSLLIAMELSTKPAVRTILTGGVLRLGELSLIGARAENSFTDLNCDAVYVGAAGVTETNGLCEFNLDDAEVKRAAIANGRRVIVLADDSKIGRVAVVTFAPIRDLDVLVTNASPNHPVVCAIREFDVEIVYATVEEE
jgi:DeoR/GlpR family transcriptional regulator of sugar metabolism